MRSATVVCGPGRKLARTRYATSPSRRSRLAGWIWSGTKSQAAQDAAGLRERGDHVVGQDAFLIDCEGERHVRVVLRSRKRPRTGESVSRWPA